MMRVVLVTDGDGALAEELPRAGVEVVRTIASAVLRTRPPTSEDAALTLHGADAIVMPAARGMLTPTLRTACDRAGVRILLLGDGEQAERLARRHGLPAPLPAENGAWGIADALGDPRFPPTAAQPERGRILAVWGPAGSPGRTTVAIQLSAALASSGRRSVALVDADAHAPSIALLLGLAEDGPGIAAACRRAELGSLDGAELSRLACIVSAGQGSIDVLTGINRPSRWPELTADRLRTTLDACRDWASVTVADIAASLETDEELMSDVSVPRRNAASLSVLEGADHVLAVASADPLGIARFVRGHAELRAHTGTTPISVLVNKVRPGPVGIDVQGQIRRALERFSGITDVQFLPYDLRAVDAAMLHARPLSDAAPRSTFAAAVMRVAARLDQIVGDPAHPAEDAPRARASIRRSHLGHLPSHGS